MHLEIHRVYAPGDLFTCRRAATRNLLGIEIEIKYPQQYQIAPCLRPIIKLELMEMTLFEKPESRPMTSLVAEQYRRDSEVKRFLCVNIESTFVEKIVSMLRRTALVERNPEERDDETLVRHIYDVHLIKSNYELDLEMVYSIFDRVIYEDVARYGNKQPEFIDNPLDEMRYALSLIKNHEKYVQRF
ncbi:nucleotidyl transferase AbiEii/AbiGii toxin family protein [Photorhabdus asymbiotica UENP]